MIVVDLCAQDGELNSENAGTFKILKINVIFRRRGFIVQNDFFGFH